MTPLIGMLCATYKNSCLALKLDFTHNGEVILWKKR
jgi:hypothetical protein